MSSRGAASRRSATTTRVSPARPTSCAWRWTAAEAPIVVGLGNRLRGDDAAGPEVARVVGERTSSAEVIEHEGEPTGLIEAWDRAPLAIVADAVAPAGHPGRIHRGIGGRKPLPFVPGAPASTHALDLAGAIDLAASLGRLPARLVVYGIEGECFDLGAPLSPPVAGAIPSLADRVLVDLGEPDWDPSIPRSRG